MPTRKQIPRELSHRVIARGRDSCCLYRTERAFSFSWKLRSVAKASSDCAPPLLAAFIAFLCRALMSSSKFSWRDRKSTRLNSSHDQISYAVFCLKKKKNTSREAPEPGMDRPRLRPGLRHLPGVWPMGPSLNRLIGRRRPKDGNASTHRTARSAPG